MSNIHSQQITTARRKPGYVPHTLHGTTSEETQLAKRIKLAEKCKEKCFDLLGDRFVKCDNGEWCSWSTPGWWLK